MLTDFAFDRAVDAFGAGAYNFGEETLLTAEVPIKRLLRGAGPGGDDLHRGVVKAKLQKDTLGHCCNFVHAASRREGFASFSTFRRGPSVDIDQPAPYTNSSVRLSPILKKFTECRGRPE